MAILRTDADSFFPAHGRNGNQAVDNREFSHNLSIPQCGAAKELDVLLLGDGADYFQDMAAGGLAEGIIGQDCRPGSSASRPALPQIGQQDNKQGKPSCKTLPL